MDYVDLANLLTGTALILSSIGPLVMAYKVKLPRIRNLTYLLCAFLVIHGTHHLVWSFGYTWLSHEILEPASVFAVIAFGVYLFRTTMPAQLSGKKAEVLPAAVAGLFVLPLSVGPDITAAALFVSFAIFILMVAKNPNVRSLHFQFAIFLLIWSLSEVFYSFSQIGINLGITDPNVGLSIHFASMVALGIFVNYRFFKIWTGVRQVGKVAPAQ